MQHTTLSGSDATGRTGHGGYLFGRKFALFHSYRMRLHALGNLFNFGLCLAFVSQTPTQDLSGNATLIWS
jgi:hypothetical protein